MTNKTKPSDVLQSIADVLLGAPDVWTTGFFARDADGRSVHLASEKAVCWCSSGLLMIAENFYGEIPFLWRFFEAAIDGVAITFWNDDAHRTPKQVQAAFQKAADLAREKGQ